MSALISIIIPVYKAESFLRTCVDSVLSQTYENIEVILVDDASPDASGKICDAYALADKRVRVIHFATNEGISIARNHGINASSGKYLMFIDDDDYISPDMCEVLLKNLIKENAQISIGGTFWTYPDHVEEVRMKETYRVISGLEATKEYFRGLGVEGLCPAPWGKLFDRNLFEKEKETESLIRFPAKRHHEDLAIIYRLFYKAQKIVITQKPMYFYVQRADSTLHAANWMHLLSDFVKLFNDYYKWGKDKEKGVALAIECGCINCFSNIVWDYLRSGSCFDRGKEQLQRLNDFIVENTSSLSKNPYATKKEKRRFWLMQRHWLLKEKQIRFWIRGMKVK